MSFTVFAVVEKRHSQSWISFVAVDISINTRGPVWTLGMHSCDTERKIVYFSIDNIIHNCISISIITLVNVYVDLVVFTRIAVHHRP